MDAAAAERARRDRPPRGGRAIQTVPAASAWRCTSGRAAGGDGDRGARAPTPGGGRRGRTIVCRGRPRGTRAASHRHVPVTATAATAACEPDAFGDYLLLGKIGQGGMADVWLASAAAGPHAGRPVALKRLLPHLHDDPGMVAMFLDEADIASQLRHDNICQVVDAGQAGGRYYLALEYLHGGSLGSLLHRLSKRRRLLKLRYLGPVVDQIGAALAAAHDRGIVHRDVSPNNIFITTSGVVKLLDFGVAKADCARVRTRAGVVKGTFAYMAPEQLEGRPVDARADVFSLGVVLHEAVTCRRLFRRDSDYLTCKAILTERPPPVTRLRPGVPQRLADAIDRAIARDPEARYPDVRRFASDVRAALREVGKPPVPEAIGREIDRVFADELDAIDDLFGAQRTRVAPATQRRAPSPAPGPRRARGELLTVLPLRAAGGERAAGASRPGSRPAPPPGRPATAAARRAASPRAGAPRRPAFVDDEFTGVPVPPPAGASPRRGRADCVAAAGDRSPPPGGPERTARRASTGPARRPRRLARWAAAIGLALLAAQSSWFAPSGERRADAPPAAASDRNAARGDPGHARAPAPDARIPR
ncbi:MAG: serine/threonine protein kinase [Deltaproteobacteria bacterium]|nr:MAG: serine/threonine protein kinase [Deltaproteobacteria bacterium]